MKKGLERLMGAALLTTGAGLFTNLVVSGATTMFLDRVHQDGGSDLAIEVARDILTEAKERPILYGFILGGKAVAAKEYLRNGPYESFWPGSYP